jgi:hypothetical protein
MPSLSNFVVRLFLYFVVRLFLYIPLIITPMKNLLSKCENYFLLFLSSKIKPFTSDSDNMIKEFCTTEVGWLL